jgi:CRP-like cAMP-binding protein
MNESFGRRTPWGEEDSPALVTDVETLLERELHAVVMHGETKPQIRRVKAGATLVRQGDEDSGELFLLLNGVLSVEVDGEALAEIGPGAVIGERALLEGGTRTATLRAVTECKVAAAPIADVDVERLAALAGGHRREDGGPAAGPG